MDTLIRILIGSGVVVSTAFSQNTSAFLEQNGLVVVEIESAPLAGSWVKETAVAGYTGSCYYTWNKGTPTSITPAGEGVLTYKIKITNAGTYFFRWHNYHNYPADQTLENDSWLKVDNGSWIKCFQNSGNAGYWNWVCKLEPSHGVFEDPNYYLSAGYHTIQVSGRSYRHSIDRFHLSKDRTNLDKKLPESPREGEPIDTTDITAILSPTAGATLNEGQTYKLIGKGKNLSWSYDANSDGLGEIVIADGDTVNFNIPTGITGPREITLILKGESGTDQILCNIGTTGIRTENNGFYCQPAPASSGDLFNILGCRVTDPDRKGCYIFLIPKEQNRRIISYIRYK